MVTVTTATPTGMLPTDQVIIAGVTDTSFDGTFPIASIIDSTALHVRADECQRHFERRHGGAGRIDLRGRAPVRGDFRDAAGIPDAAFAADFVDGGRRHARERDGHSFAVHAAECRGAHSGVHRSGRRPVFITRRGSTARRRCRFSITARRRSSWIFPTPRCSRASKRIRCFNWSSSANARA